MLAATGGVVYLHPSGALAERPKPDPSASILFTAVCRIQRALVGESDTAWGYSEKSNYNGIMQYLQEHDLLGNYSSRINECRSARIGRG